MLKKFKDYIFIIPILFSLVVYFRWLSFNVFAYGDYVFQFSEALASKLQFSAWYSFGFGEINLFLSRLAGPDHIFFGIFGNLGFDSNIADKFMILLPWTILSTISSFLLVKEVTKSNTAGLIGSVIFSFNSYYLSINSEGHLLLSTASVYAIFAFLFFIKLSHSVDMKKNILFTLLTSLFLFGAGANDLRVLYMIVWVLFSYTIYYQFFITSGSNLKALLTHAIKALSPIVILVLLNLFWLIPAALIGSLATNDAVTQGLFGNTYLDLVKAITLFHPFWTHGKIEWFVVQKIPILFWISPIYAILGLIVKRKDKTIVFFGLLTLIGILLTKQVGLPYSDLYPALFKYLPGFNAFREATKFFFIIALGYSVLIGAFTSWLWESNSRNLLQLICKYLLTFLIVVAYINNTIPIFTGSAQATYIQRTIPKDYLIFRNFILKQNDYFRTYWTPGFSRWSIYTSQKPVLNNTNTISKEWKNLLPIDGANTLPINEKIIQIYKAKIANEIFDISSIKYVIVPLQDKENDDDFFIYFGHDRNFFIKELDKINWLHRINIGTKKLVIYKNEDARPHIYITDVKETIYRNISYLEIKPQTIDTTKYDISLSAYTRPFYLNFSEAFHPDWKIRIGRFNWLDAIIRKNYFVPEKNHFENDAKLNSFYIDPATICKTFECTRNQDGSYNLRLTLYFRPQSYMYIGLIVSTTVLIACIAYISYAAIVYLRKKKHV